MNDKNIEVVGTMFFKDGKILIDKPRNRSAFQMIGGRIEEGELPLEAAIRECKEELGEKAILDVNSFEFVMDFIEIATSDSTKKIHMHIYKYKGNLEGDLSVSEEIESFMWFGINDDYSLLSNTLKNRVIPYAIENGLIY